VANKGLKGYGTWKSAEVNENKELTFPALRLEARREAQEWNPTPLPPINDA